MSSSARQGGRVHEETAMQTQKRTDYVTRDEILKLLSDNEVARVSSAETAGALMDGDEYLDLEQLTQGVRRVKGTVKPIGRVLAKKAVQEATWSKIVTKLPKH
jgi:hypothetical protein